MKASATLMALAAALPAMARNIPRADNGTDLPGTPLVNFGILLFPAFDMVDITGALEALQFVSVLQQQMNLSIISASGPGPVSTALTNPAMNKFNSSFAPAIMATHSLEEAADLDLDVLILPGGPGVRNIDGTANLVDFVRDVYPNLEYLLTICTGAGLAARAGVMDGKNATTNKKAWETITAMGPKVNWVAPARYVKDGNVWSSSGVTAGFDMMYEFIKEMWSEKLAETIHATIEYDPRPADFDPYTDYFNIPHTV